MKLEDVYRGRDHKIKPTLERIQKAVDFIGNPQRDFPAVLVGGTNGKGSTCAFVESVFRHHGLKTGWFVSPHLISENERWRVNGEPITCEDLSSMIKELKGVFSKFELTYFEAATLIACKYFSEVGVDVGVFEVGMGGRWDATKVCLPEVICITNVGRDHTRWLGDTIEDIAVDKLHLYRNGAPFVVGSPVYPLYPKAVEMGYRDMVVAGVDFQCWGRVEGYRTLLGCYEFGELLIKDVELGLWGKWQISNAALAVTISSLFLRRLDVEKVRTALGNTRWEGRMEILREKPLLIVDGAHNPHAISVIVKHLRGIPKMRIAFTGLKGKEWRESLEIIRGYIDEIILVPVSSSRGENIVDMRDYALSLGFKKVEVLSDVVELLSFPEDICAFGSLYLVGEIKEALQFSVI